MKVEIQITWDPTTHSYTQEDFKINSSDTFVNGDSLFFYGRGSIISIGNELQRLRDYKGVSAHATLVPPEWLPGRLSKVWDGIGAALWP